MIVPKSANFTSLLVIKKNNRIPVSLLDFKLMLKSLILSFNVLVLTMASFNLSSQTYLLNNSTNGSTINTNSGTFFDSGGSNNNYSTLEEYTVTFCSTSGAKLEFNFTSFNVENGWDFFYVYDGSNISSPQINGSPFSGNGDLSGTITSSGSCFTFRFSSDDIITTLGWAANISVNGTPEDCTNGIDDDGDNLIDCDDPDCVPSSNNTLEMYAGAGNTTANGTSAASQNITLQNNTDNPTGSSYSPYNPSLIASYVLSNHQYTIPSGYGTPGVGIYFGGRNGNGNIAGVAPIFPNMNYISGPSNNLFTSAETINSGAGIDININRTIEMYSSFVPLDLNGSSTNGRYHYGDLTITFNQSIANPILHIAGLGAVVGNLGISTELELQTSGVTLTKLSGNSNLNVISNNILNSNSTPNASSTSGAATGSILVQGQNITSLHFEIYVRGDGQASQWFTGDHAGDAYTIGISKLTLENYIPLGCNQIGSTIDVSCFEGNNGSFQVEATGGIEPISYNIGGGPQNNGNFNNLNAGTYNVTISDDYGCEANCEITISQPDEISCEISENKPISCSGNSDASATAIASGGNGGYIYAWDNGEITATAIGLNAGFHTVTVTDSQGCNTTCSITINDISTLSCNAEENSGVSCLGGMDGSATVTANGGSVPISTPDAFNEIWIEAECQTVGSNWDIINDNSRSNNQNITWTGGNTYNAPSTNPNNLNIYNFQVNTAGTYQLWGLCRVPNSGDDSFWVRVDDNDWVRWNQITGSSAWEWDDLHDDRLNGASAISYPLSIGVHTITISYRENGASLDKLHLTSNGSTPNGLGGVDTGCATLSYNYSWDNGENTPTAVSLTSGIHTVTVTDSNNCSTTCSVNINQPSSPVTCTIALNSFVSCESSMDGEATVLPNGGTEPYTYLWDNGVTSANANNLTFGLHFITVTDSNGCTTTCSVDIISIPGLDKDNDGVNDIRDLDDDNDGIPDCVENNVNCSNSILGPNLIINGDFSQGYKGWTSDFNRGRNNHTNSPATNGGCDLQGWIAISPCETFNGICDEYYSYYGALYDGSLIINDPVGIGDNIFNTICDASANACEPRQWPDNTGNGDNLSLYIDPSDIVGKAYWRQEIYIQSCVTYEFSAYLQTVEEDPNLVFRVGGVNIAGPFNFNGLIPPNGGPDIWQQVATTWESTINGIVTIELVNTTAGCAGNDIKLDDIFFGEIWCDTDFDGIANHLDLDSDNDGIPDAVEACGNIGLTLEECSLDWNNSETYNTDPSTGCSNGVISGSGCFNINDTDNDNIPDFIDLDSDNDGCSDAIEACTDSNPNVNTSSISDNYTNPASSVNSCGLVPDGSSYLCPTLVNTNWINNSIGCIECVVNLNQNEQCFGNADGSATILSSGGTLPHTYLWDNGESSATAINLSGGTTHFVTVTDDCGHSSICNILIDQPSEMTCTAIQENEVSCLGGDDGIGFVTPVGGFGEKSYLWDNGETNRRSTNLTAGNHTVTVTDFNGCTTSCSVSIDEPESSVSIDAGSNITICDGESVVLNATPTGGSPGYSFEWSNGQTAQNINVNPIGAPNINTTVTYSVTVTDNNDCTAIDNIDVTIESNPTATIMSSNPTCTEDNGSITFSFPDHPNRTGIQFSLNNQSTYESGINDNTGSITYSDLAEGTYNLWVRWGNGECPINLGSVVLQDINGLPQCTISEDSPVSCKGETDGSATATANGGNGGYNYLWDNGETNANATTLNAGLHSVTVTDSEGCTTSCSILINEPSNIISCNIIENSSVICKGENNGIATVTAIGGNGSYTFVWDNGETNATATALDSGLHIVTVTDSKGCSSQCSVTINEPENIVSVMAGFLSLGTMVKTQLRQLRLMLEFIL